MFAFPFFIPLYHSENEACVFPVLQGTAVGKGFKGSGKRT